MKTNAQFSAMRKGAPDMSLVPLSHAGGEAVRGVRFTKALLRPLVLHQEYCDQGEPLILRNIVRPQQSRHGT